MVFFIEVGVFSGGDRLEHGSKGKKGRHVLVEDLFAFCQCGDVFAIDGDNFFFLS